MQKDCKVCGKPFIKKWNESRKYWVTKKYCSKECADSVGLWNKHHVPWNKGKKYPQVTGSLNKNWKGGITSENDKIRKSRIYKIWVKAVFEKDDYTCQKCGQRGVYLHAHHLKPFAIYPQLRFAIDNGQTLCRECHKNINHVQLLKYS